MQQNETYRQFFKGEPGSAENNTDLKKITEQHPYFGLANYFLLKNTDIAPGKYSALAEKAAFLFNDDFLLNARLHQPDHWPEAEIKEEITEATELIPAQKDIEKISEAVSIQTVSESEIMFEPLHASDYFASQGIKLSAEMLGDDKLGKQLKSFTSWLKTMKKVHPDKMSETGKATDTAIQNIAEKSNREEEVLTEAMAEAYRLQGKNAKAMETYEKLSLLNPAKSAYFAAKIESLKK